MTGVGFDAAGRPLKTFPQGSTASSESIPAVVLVDMAGVPITSLGGGSGSSQQYQVASFPAAVVGNQCVKLVDGQAIVVTSVDTDCPWIDAITLQGGTLGSTGIVATSTQINYTTTESLPGVRVLFLGQDGRLTPTAPSSASGDRWSVIVARKTGTNQFIFDPQIPIKLL